MARLGALVGAAAIGVVLLIPVVGKARPHHSSGIRLDNVAERVGLDFRQGAFRFGVSPDPLPMLGGGVCWLDYDNDGWLDLFVVNSYSGADAVRWKKRGGLPRSALFRNVKGRFVNVSRRSRAALAVQGNGCVAADLNGDGRTDLYVTTTGYDKLLWNTGRGRFSEGARVAGIRSFAWHAGAAAGDVNGDRRVDLYVAGYANVNAPVPGSDAGFPQSHVGIRDRLYLNMGRDRLGRSRFREVGIEAGLEAVRFDHSLGAVFIDYDHDGRLDLYVANDGEPNRLYQNVGWPGGAKADPSGLGFRFEERAAAEGVADPNAGMGVAAADYDGDGRSDLFVTNSRGQTHAVYQSQPSVPGGPAFADVRGNLVPAFGRRFTGWGVSWTDLDLDGNLDLVIANGAIPVRNLPKDAEPVQVLENLAGRGTPGTFADASAAVGVRQMRSVIGRGLAAADYDNDGRVDLAVNTIGGRLALLRNTGAAGHWLEVHVKRFSPGAEVTAVLPDGRRLVRRVQAGSSYLSSEDPRVHFGLGKATTVRELVVRYPDGAEARRADVPADRIVSVDRVATAERKPSRTESCQRTDLRGRSVARVWNEALLDAIRRDVPAPTTHARNLFHLSAAMWDAWAAYDPKADGYFVSEKHGAKDLHAAREQAISYAAYRILLWRYSYSANVKATFAQLTATMRSLCYDPNLANRKGGSPAALGNRIAAAVIEYGKHDGSRERQKYVDTSYRPVNPPLIVKEAAVTMHDPTLWQPLALDQIVTQNGLPVPGKVQTFIGAGWGRVRGFALPESRKGLPFDPGGPAIGGPRGSKYKRAAVDVIRRSSELDPTDVRMVEIGLNVRGNNPLGTNSGRGYKVNPVTGEPYAGQKVRLGDFTRLLAEVWADGPASETPPGHWNVIANTVSDSPLLTAKVGRSVAARLRWDVRLYLALNSSLHDAAIAAWGVKRAYQSVRPISMIRYLADNGQSSDRKAPSYHPDGLPLVPGLIEVITRASSAPGQRHAALAEHIGAIAIRAWRGPPKDSKEPTGVGWILGTRWMPYQRATFVTPAFPGFVSGHSTFSRAAAEVLTRLTGSRYFPGGVHETVFPRGSLGLENGPSQPVTLAWATYYDAADQAGQSRIYGGIHIVADDFAGRRMGSKIGKKAFALAQRYIAGTAR